MTLPTLMELTVPIGKQYTDNHPNKYLIPVL